jgi:aquaporin NIP
VPAQERVPLGNALAAEAIGTFALVFAGCGAVMVEAKTRALGQVGIAAALGRDHDHDLRRRARVGRPFQSRRELRLRADAPIPLGARSRLLDRPGVGALLAAALLRASLGDVGDVGATLPSGSDGQSFLWEAVLTFFLMFVVMAVATDTRAVGEAAAIAIGGTVALDALFGGPISGASMNPARSFGPALVAGETGLLWLYVVAPLCGATLGALSYQLVRGARAP